MEKKYVLGMTIIGILFFIFGFVTWVNSTLITYLKIACQLKTNFQALMVASAFYIAYAVFAIPSGYILKQTGYKRGMMVGLFIMAAGALIFIPAAQSRTYGLFLLGLFVIGAGLAVLQTASNPYVTVLGPIESAAKRISIMGICNKIAGALGPLVLGKIVLDNADAIDQSVKTMDIVHKNAALDALASRVVVPYAILAVVLVLLGIFVLRSGLPEIDTDQNDDSQNRTKSPQKNIFDFPHLWLGVLALFIYVGVEVIAGDAIGLFGRSQGFSIETTRYFTSFTLVAMVVGYIIGIITTPKYLKQETALAVSAVAGVFFSIAASLTSGPVSVTFVALFGLANAIMWPAIWPLALKGLGSFTKIGSSLLIIAIAGGGILPPLFAQLTDVFKSHSQSALWLVVPCYLYILYYAVSGHLVGKRSKLTGAEVMANL